MHAHWILLVLDRRLHDRYATVLVRGIPRNMLLSHEIFCFLDCLRFFSFSIASALDVFFNANSSMSGTYMMIRLLVRCSACFLSHPFCPAVYDHSRKMFRLVSSILDIFSMAHGPRSLKLPVVPGCRFVEHGPLNHCVTQQSFRRILFFFHV